jgi:hypothetical protein
MLQPPRLASKASLCRARIGVTECRLAIAALKDAAI